MARPQRNNVDYFPFLCEEGEKMYYLEETYGNDGFATFVKLLRELAKVDYHYLNLSKPSSLMFLSAKCKVSKEVLEAIISDLVMLEKFDKVLWTENKVIWCQDFIDSIQDAYSKRSNVCIDYKSLLVLLTSLGVRKPSKGIPKLPKGNLKVDVNPQSIVNYNKEEYTIEECFDLFWSKYPKKVAKDKCKDKFLKLKQPEIEKILSTIDAYVAHKPFETYNHPNPETYLNQKRWEDDIEVKTLKPKPTIHDPFVDYMDELNKKYAHLNQPNK